MENTQDLNACVTKLQKNILRWENRLQSGQGDRMYFVRRWAGFEPLWIASAGPDFSDWRKRVRSPRTP